MRRYLVVLAEENLALKDLPDEHVTAHYASVSEGHLMFFDYMKDAGGNYLANMHMIAAYPPGVWSQFYMDEVDES